MKNESGDSSESVRIIILQHLYTDVVDVYDTVNNIYMNKKEKKNKYIVIHI